MANLNKNPTRLTLKRRELGLTRTALAKLSGISDQTIAKWEQRAYNITDAKISHLVTISKALNCSINDIIEDDIPCGIYSEYSRDADTLSITNLECVRLSRRLSRTDLEKISGISARTIEQYEQRRASINGASARIVLALAKALEVDVTDILE